MYMSLYKLRSLLKFKVSLIDPKSVSSYPSSHSSKVNEQAREYSKRYFIIT